MIYTSYPHVYKLNTMYKYIYNYFIIMCEVSCRVGLHMYMNYIYIYIYV